MKKDDYMTIPLLDLQREHREMAGEVEDAINKTVKDAKYILGPQVAEFEEQCSDYIGSKNCIGLASGTDALLLSLRALALKTKGKEYFEKDDQVITTPFTFTATGGAILRSGATPVFVDLDLDTYNLDPGKVKEAINAKTVGIIPVHLYGKACKLDQLMDMARKHSLFVLEDVAQAFGAYFDQDRLGSIGDLGAFSFFPSKNLGCLGDGGMVATSDLELAELVKMLRKHGGKDKYDVEHLGYNSRLDTLQAAVLLVKLKYVDRFNSLRKIIAGKYSRQLNDLDWLVPPDYSENESHVYHQYTIRITNGQRDQVQRALQDKGIVSAVYYPVPLHKMKLYKNRCQISGSLRNTEQACKEVLSLPVEPLLSDREIDYVVKNIRSLPLKEQV